MQPRVFVSSVMEGFEEFRQAAKKGIIAAGAEPVLVEDFPALPFSPRNACLDGVTSCDIYIGIVGNRGGWTSPSGKLVVEEEYEEARRRRLRVLAFIQDVDKDTGAQRFVTALSDYIGGVLRPTFTTPADLQTIVDSALKQLMHHYVNPKVDKSMIQEKLIKPYEFNNNEACLRFVLATERIEEVIDHVYIGSQEFMDHLYSIGHSAQVCLFSYERRKKHELGINEIVILQSDRARGEGLDEVRLEITVGGMIVIDANVTSRVVRRPDSMDSSFYIYKDDLVAVLKKCFLFSNAFYAAKDPYMRYDRLFYNASLAGVVHRTLVSQPPQGGTYYLSHHAEEVFPAFDQPRLITRIELASPDEEIERVKNLFQRRLKTQ